MNIKIKFCQIKLIKKSHQKGGFFCKIPNLELFSVLISILVLVVLVSVLAVVLIVVLAVILIFVLAIVLILVVVLVSVLVVHFFPPKALLISLI